MLRNARLRIAAAMAKFAALFGQNVPPEVQYSREATRAPKFQMAPRRTRRARLVWDSWRLGTYVRIRENDGEVPDYHAENARLVKYQGHCNKNRQKRLAAMRAAVAKSA